MIWQISIDKEGESFMKRLNKKGFSMVELLAVIVILGILGTMAIVSISAILNRV